MSTETPDGNSPSPPPPKTTKQERIRDNQRRSRARRQEYLVDLERRLSECQITCRSADIQRSAFLELQIENARLRELLALAGVNDQFVEHYVSQAIAQSGQFPQESNPSLRQLKPKLSGLEPAQPANAGSLPAAPPGIYGQQTASMRPMNASYTSMGMSDGYNASPSTTTYSPSTPFVPSLQDTDATRDMDWLYQQLPQPAQSQEQTESFNCETFLVPSQGPVGVADDSSVLCSVAKQMIDQFHISSAEMDDVKTKLSQGFFRPPYPGAGCAVNNQTLFQVLNELSQKYS